MIHFHTRHVVTISEIFWRRVVRVVKGGPRAGGGVSRFGLCRLSRSGLVQHDWLGSYVVPHHSFYYIHFPYIFLSCLMSLGFVNVPWNLISSCNLAKLWMLDVGGRLSRAPGLSYLASPHAPFEFRVFKSWKVHKWSSRPFVNGSLAQKTAERARRRRRAVKLSSFFPVSFTTR